MSMLRIDWDDNSRQSNISETNSMMHHAQMSSSPDFMEAFKNEYSLRFNENSNQISPPSSSQSQPDPIASPELEPQKEFDWFGPFRKWDEDDSNSSVATTVVLAGSLSQSSQSQINEQSIAATVVISASEGSRSAHDVVVPNESMDVDIFDNVNSGRPEESIVFDSLSVLGDEDQVPLEFVSVQTVIGNYYGSGKKVSCDGVEWILEGVSRNSWIFSADWYIYKQDL